jgi:hypothetical protein
MIKNCPKIRERNCFSLEKLEDLKNLRSDTKTTTSSSNMVEPRDKIEILILTKCIR